MPPARSGVTFNPADSNLRPALADWFDGLAVEVSEALLAFKQEDQN